MKYIMWLIAVTTIGFTSSCKKQCIKQQVVYSLGPGMFNYIFRDTSVFVYINTSTNARDTQIMFQEYNGQEPLDTFDECVDLEKQYFHMNVYDKLSGANTFYYYDYNGISQDGEDNFTGQGQRVYDSNLKVSDSSYYLKYIAGFNMLTIQGANIYGIKEFRTNIASVDYPKTTYLFWAPYCGIVRKTILNNQNDSTTWELMLNKSHLIYY